MKKVFFCLLPLVLCACLYGCVTNKSDANGSGSSTTNTPGNFQTESPSNEQSIIKDKNEFEQRIPNYSCEIEIKNTGSKTVTLKYKVHPDGIAFQTDMTSQTFIIYNFKDKKVYVLDEKDKTAISMDSPDMQNSFAHPATYFMAWGNTSFSSMQKGSLEKVDGRNATMYFYKLGTSEVKYYIDNELGFCLAYEVITDGTVQTRWEMKNFKAGNVKAADITVPAGYTITHVPTT